MKVGVLLSSYNGQRFIDEQIDSILRQENVDIQLYIRDDGSTDATLDIIKKHVHDDSRIILINENNRINIGVKNSFFELLQFSHTHGQCDFFSFADQDDFWEPDKLYSAVQMLHGHSNDNGSIYFSNKTIADEQLRKLYAEELPYYNNLYEIFWINQASGCTMVFDKAFAGILSQYVPKGDYMHDAWIYRVAKLIGADIVFDPISHILYRQHDNNTRGVTGSLLYHTEKSYILKKFIPKLFSGREHNILHQVCEIQEAYRMLLTPSAEELIEDFKCYRSNLITKMKFLFSKDIKVRPKKDRVIWAYRVLMNWIP